MFANEIEEAIISVGVKIVMRPATKDVTKEVAVEGGIAAIEGNQAAHKSGEGKLIERYVAFEDIDADYIVYTYAGSKQIRIIKKQSREILAVLKMEAAYRNAITGKRERGSYSRAVSDALASMGIPVIANRQ